MTSREVQEILRRHGFILISQKGSRQEWRSLVRSLQVIVPHHPCELLPLGTMLSIMRAPRFPNPSTAADPAAARVGFRFFMRCVRNLSPPTQPPTQAPESPFSGTLN